MLGCGWGRKGRGKESPGGLEVCDVGNAFDEGFLDIESVGLRRTKQGRGVVEVESQSRVRCLQDSYCGQYDI